MIQQDISNFAGLDGFCWFIGVVEARIVLFVDGDGKPRSVGDPAKLGRVKVRCIGYHTQDKDQLPTKDLPWASVMHPTNSPGISGVGGTSNLIEGTTVFGFFLDAHDKQHPVVIGCIPGRDAPGSGGDPRAPLSPSSGAPSGGEASAAASEAIDAPLSETGKDLEDCLYNKGIYGKYDPKTGEWPEMREGRGGQNGKLRQMFKEIGHKGRTGEGTHWCAAFVTHALKCAGKKPLSGNNLSSRAYQNYPGDVVWDGKGEIPYDKFQKGDIMVFERDPKNGPPDPSKGHVGFYHGTKGKNIRLINGNAGGSRFGGGTLKVDTNGRNPRKSGRKLLRVIRAADA